MPFDASGLNRLVADFAASGPKALALAELVIKKTSFDIEKTAKLLAPVDTGDMRDSIGIDPGTLEATIGPTVNYAPYVEYGTSRQSPQPFMGPALDKHAYAYLAAMEQIGIPGVG